MNPKRLCIFAAGLLLLQIYLPAQDKLNIKFGKVSPEDFNLPASAVVDSNSSAIILADIGNTSFEGNKKGRWVSYVFVRHTRIKIVSKNAFDLATVRLYLLGNDERKDKLDDIQGSTYNLENGKLVETKISLTDLFENKVVKNLQEVKFTMPNVKEGSIIEYSYKIVSYRYYSLPSWSFQNLEYPCLYSEFEISVPDFLSYMMIHHGVDSFSLVKAEEGYQSFHLGGANLDANSAVHKKKWIMKNVSAFKTEPFVYSPRDYLDKIEFRLVQTSNKEDVTSWKKTTKELLETSQFGAAITPENASGLHNTLERISPAEDTGYISIAKHIYSYIRDNFICVPDNDIYIDNDLYTVNRKKRGSVQELNLLLVALLRQKWIDASPVILSTAEYGVNPAAYPELDKMNYVICMMKKNGDTTYLDATRSLLGFGKLPLDCYNGHARIISEQDSGSIFLYRDNIKEQKSTTVIITNDGKEAMKGRLESTPGYFESYDIRNKFGKSNEKDFFSSIQLSIGPEIKIEHTGIDSLKNLEDPVKAHFDFSFKVDNSQDILYYSPVIQSSLKENPFAATNRKYSIEMPYAVDDIYTLNMEIPDGYAVAELPKSVKVAYNDNEGSFEYMIEENPTNIQLLTHIKLNKATFAASDYNSLRDFFAYIISKQSEQIVFKKKK